MFKKIALFLLFPLILLFGNSDRPPVAYPFLEKQNVQTFMKMMHHRYGFSYAYLEGVLSQAKLDRDTLARYEGKFKKNSTIGTWERFKLHVVNPQTFQEARLFKKKYRHTLAKASKRYKVESDYLVGFLGVESHFGNYMGDYNTLSALTTLAFFPNRMQKLFASELKHLFLFAREKRYDITKLEGSFAGAMGCVQQLPSVARKFHQDFDGDGASIWDIEDCIGSIAKFLHHHGWKKGEVVAIEAEFKGKRFHRLKTGHKRRYSLKKLKQAGVIWHQPFRESSAYLLKLRNRHYDELYLGGSNFRILTLYNNATTYGMAIVKIAQAIK
jgi:membrane-bound lytic murein transglycosylase B